MAEQPQIPDSVTPEQFFEQLLPMGFQTQTAQGGAAPPQDFAIQFHVTGDGGGDWLAKIGGGAMQVNKGNADANLTVTLWVDDWRDAVLARNGASLSLILPQARAGRPDNSGRAKALRGTMALELSRSEKDPFKVELCFNNAATPKTTLRMSIADYLGMQEGKQNGQQLFMAGKIRVEGDMAFLMQIASLNM